MSRLRMSTRAMLPFLRVSTTGLLLILLGNLLFALNIFVMTLPGNGRADQKFCL